MSKVLLVEDEQIVRLALKSLVDWESNNIYIVGEASNGKEAIDFLNKNTVDLIITDINMPVKNGLELIEETTKKWPHIKIIVLSAYNDYNLVRQSFKFGIKDYILKSEMEPQQVLDLVLLTLKDNQKQEKNAAYYSHVDKIALLKSLSNGTYINDINKEMIDSYNLRIDVNNYLSCVLLLDDFKKISLKYSDAELKDLIKHVLETLALTINKENYGEVLCMETQIYHIIFTCKSNSLINKRNRTEAMLKNIQHNIKVYLDLSISIGVSKEMDNVDYLNKSYEEALSNARLRYLFGKGKIIFPEDVNFIKQRDVQRILGREKALLEAIKSYDKLNVIFELDNLLGLISTFKSQSIKDLIGYYLELIFIIINYLNELDSISTNIFEHNTNFYEIISQFETKEEINSWFRNFVSNIIDYQIKSSSINENHTIKQAKRFINEKYIYGIGLSDVAQHVELSESYLSKLFIDETNESFVQYITRVRIEKAKELLLNTNMKIYEISQAVGYENSEHFSRVFKKQIGMSPILYKKNN